MKNKNKQTIGITLLVVSALFLAIHAITKLMAANWADWQHWLVLVVAVVLIPLGLFFVVKKK